MISITDNNANHSSRSTMQMSADISRPAWMEDELVRGIPERKLDFLAELFGQTVTGEPDERPSQKVLMLRLLPKLRQAKAEHLELTPTELQAAIAAIRKYSDAQANRQIDEILAKAGS